MHRAPWQLALLSGLVACSSITDTTPDDRRLGHDPAAGPRFASAGTLAVAPIFRSDMVLQQGVKVPVFGTAAPGASVTVAFAGQDMTVTAAGDGRWRVDLDALPASATAASLTVTSGGEAISFTGVQVGEVWLCSGQSNMGKPLSYAVGGGAAAAAATNHNLRLFRMTGGTGPAASAWVRANASTAAGFSAVCYWMGLELSQRRGVPVGLIQATHDGTSISQWLHGFGGTGADYDAMVRAIQPFAVRGVAWYQGESDAGDTAYDLRLASMIGEWRSDWGLAALPFGIVQLTWRPSGWTAAREGQLRASRTVSNTFLVVTTDLPVSNYLHPAEKKPVGIRLAIGADGAVYGQTGEYSSPIPQSATAAGNTVVVTFSHTGSGLFTANGKAPGPFRVAGSNGRFQNATATIVGNEVRVTSSVAVPKTVRYQWDYGVGNLNNAVTIAAEGGSVQVNRLPASQFEFKLQ